MDKEIRGYTGKCVWCGAHKEEKEMGRCILCLEEEVCFECCDDNIDFLVDNLSLYEKPFCEWDHDDERFMELKDALRKYTRAIGVCPSCDQEKKLTRSCHRCGLDVCDDCLDTSYQCLYCREEGEK